MRKRKALELLAKISTNNKYEEIHTAGHFDNYDNLICRDWVHEFRKVKNENN